MKVFKKQIPYIFYAILLFSLQSYACLSQKILPISATAVTGDNGKTENNAQITVDNGNGDGGTDDTPTDGNTDESVINKKLTTEKFREARNRRRNTSIPNIYSATAIRS
jgi:hypothetical protein